MGVRAAAKKAGAFRLQIGGKSKSHSWEPFVPCLAQCMGTQTNHPPPLAQTFFQTCLGQQQEGLPRAFGET